MDRFNDLFTTFLCLEIGDNVAVYGGAESFHQTYLNLCSENEWRSYGLDGEDLMKELKCLGELSF